ncbi:MAG: hypothetical protein AUK55_05150 [Syntrophobacteraceae bacterium CG2_30_61_12]|nr:MAG: hypothetical protein AUK55_05150 [Syntrophobacteraceae bacterium CG2_30_61_12]PIU31613.1 MAG: hypothetical protein COT06_07200 [Syntrophobacteraceae bacterium CG07_land_8_20_14_0_80_61_8]
MALEQISYDEYLKTLDKIEQRYRSDEEGFPEGAREKGLAICRKFRREVVDLGPENCDYCLDTIYGLPMHKPKPGDQGQTPEQGSEPSLSAVPIDREGTSMGSDRTATAGSADPKEQQVICAHCGKRIARDQAIRYEHHLLYGEHYHCRECDPGGVWDCMSHDFDTDLH